MKVVAIVQARMGSTRMPGKVMQKINGIPMIEILLKRLARVSGIDQIVVATSIEQENTILLNHVVGMGFCCEMGSENDVLARYYEVAKKYQADVVIRVTGDCPLIDSSLVADCLRVFQSENCDYLSNIDPPSFPDGLDTEIFSIATLKEAHENASSHYDREHVTPFIRRSQDIKKFNIQNSEDLSSLRWTVDESCDFEVISNVINFFHPNIYFSWSDVLALHQKSPGLFEANKNINRNEGEILGTGQKLWKHAKTVIPGGNMLLSKRPEMFLPDQWPAYFSKAKGCTVWDLDGREYLDVSIMGIGTNILGYGHPKVDDAVKEVIRDGNMATFNCKEEVMLADRLIGMHPWSGMVKFARTGGEANAIAIRIARAASGKDKVAFCGYHGWHDWYLSANLADGGRLDGHLLPGLEPKGVPRNLSDTIFPFEYNNFEQLEELVRDHEIGVIKMEVSRNMGPKNGFLEKIRTLATNKNIVLVFDECTSGFRETFGGLHQKYGVEPDIATYGKALGNGYAITAVLGRKEVMESAQSTFISSTFWTERIGPAAALKTLDVMEEMKSWELITRTGLRVKKLWQDLANAHNLKINQWGIPALAGFTFESKESLAYKTLITQEMLSVGYIGGNSIYACTDHTDAIIDQYFERLSTVFGLIESCENGSRSISEFLRGDVCHSGFKRLN